MQEMQGIKEKFITSIKSNVTMPNWAWRVKPDLTKAIRETDKHRVLSEVMAGRLPPFQHQQELITKVSEHLSKPANIGLNISYQTPTGSGKTSSLLLLQNHLRKNFPDVVLIMGAPATLLSRAIPEMEAQNESNYWTMYQTDNGDFCVVRPKSSMLNVKREKKKWQGIIKEDDDSFTGKKTTIRPNENKERHPTITQQMWQANQQRARAHDPVPNVILADIFAIRKMLEELNRPIQVEMPNEKGEPDRATLPGWLRSDNMVLFLDEPNMGIINSDIQECIQEILVHKPNVCVLASATLGDWATIPEWWQGRPGELHIISSSPYEQPGLELLNANLAVRRIHKMTPLDLVMSNQELYDTFSQLNNRQQATITRYFSREQIAQLTGADKDIPLPELRENYLIPLFRNDKILSDDVNTLKKPQADITGEPCSKLRNCLNKSGMTLIAAINPFKTAMDICGFKSEDDYFKAKHDMQSLARNTISAEQKRQKAVDRAAKAKYRDEDTYSDEDEDQITRVKIGRVTLTASEIEDIIHDNDIDTLIFLSYGIVISSQHANRTARKLFQRAVLSLPDNILESSAKRPSIHCLVTDYSGIYGIDCAGIKRVIIMEDLAKLLTPDDIVQATGRVRREGQILVLNPNVAAKLLGFRENNWSNIFTSAISNKLSQMPQSTISEQKLILQELHRTPFAGITYTGEELVFNLFLHMAIQNEFKTISKPWSNGIFKCWNFDDLDKFMQMFQNYKSHPNFINSQSALIYMYNIFEFDIIGMQNWLKLNSSPSELSSYSQFMNFVEEDDSNAED